MRTLKYAILGLLNQKEMTGYDLMKQFESTLCEFWSAKHSQIYPELKKLTEEGASLIRRSLLTTRLRKKFIISRRKGGGISSTGFLLRRSRSLPRRISPG